jgi:NAD+ synthase
MNREQLADKLVLWIRDKVLAAGLKGVVFGMSGGLDSSVVAVLCKRTFKENTLGLLMPCYSGHQDEQHALAVASQFSIQTRTIVLDATYDILMKSLPVDKASAPSQLVQANLKARLRMLTLYYFANQFSYLVAGSGNKSELSVGYFTKYGDGGVDILPLGNLVKGQVTELAEFLGIPQAIIDKPPSAGLWPGQTDEGELGLSYKQLDRYLTTGKAPDIIKKKIELMIAMGSHKRQPPLVPDF